MFTGAGVDVRVVRNDRVTVDELLASAPDRVVLSPGPGRPEDAGVLGALARRLLDGPIPTLGVCLGHQALAWAAGASIVRVPPRHGKTSRVTHDGAGLFRGSPEPLVVARYHSLAVDPASMPPWLVPTAYAEDGVLMAFRHRHLPIHGLQYHPESFLTPEGPAQLLRFLDDP